MDKEQITNITLIGGTVGSLGLSVLAWLKYFRNNKKQEEKNIDPRNNEFFNQLLELINETGSISVEEHPAKTEILRIFLNCKVSVLYELTWALVNDPDNYIIDKDDLEVKVNDLLTESSKLVDERFQKECLERGLQYRDIDIVFDKTGRTRIDIRNSVKLVKEDFFRKGKNNGKILNDIFTSIRPTLRILLEIYKYIFIDMNGKFDKYEVYYDNTTGKKKFKVI